jgi:hypothetical protein
MNKRHFGVVAVTFVGGIVVMASGGCSGALDTSIGDGGASSTSSGSSGASSTSSGASSTASSSGSSGTSGASGSSGIVDSGGDAKDASHPTDAGDGAVGPGMCPTPDPIDATLLPWKAPAISAGACSSAELAALVTYVDTHPAAKYPDWKATVANAACAGCIFGKETDAMWRPLLEDAAGQLVGMNVGGCIGIASANEACGKSYQHWFDCRFEACTDCPAGNTAALQKCLTAASKGACKNAFDAVGTVCGDTAIGDAETACGGDKFVFEGPIRAQCIGLQ